MRLYLSGLPQEEIASETGASEGTVNAVLQEAILLDNTLKLQRDVAIVAKRSAISVQQLASALAVENSIKRQAFEQGKVHSVLKAIDHTFTQDGRLEPELVGKIFLQITELYVEK